MYLWLSLCTLYLHACQVRVTVTIGDSGLCCCLCDVFWELINSLVCCFCASTLGLVLFRNWVIKVFCFLFSRPWITQRWQLQRKWRKTRTGKRLYVTTGWRERRKPKFLFTSTRTEYEARNVCVRAGVCAVCMHIPCGCVWKEISSGFFSLFVVKLKINYHCTNIRYFFQRVRVVSMNYFSQCMEKQCCH